MKFAKFTVVALFAVLLSVSCAGEKISFGNGDDNTISNKGYLSISNLTIDCRIDEKEPDTGIDPTHATRTSVDVNNFDCSIINEEGEVVKSFKYSERPTEAIELETGDYTFNIQSGEVPGAAWESPVYGATRLFKIVRNETTPISEVVCSLMQIKVTITYSTDLLERLGDKTTTTVKVGNNSLKYVLTESRAGFFIAPQINNTIELNISGKYAADKVNFKDIKMNKEVPNVTAGQHSKIHLYIEYAAEGNINAGDIVIRDWVTDEVIPCNVADAVTEEEWKEDTGGDEGGETPTADPRVVWLGYNLSEWVTIEKGSSGEIATTGEIMVYASKGIKELIVQIESNVLTPSLLGMIGLADVMNITYPERSYDSSNPERVIDAELMKSMLSSEFDFPICDEVIGKTQVPFSITKFMGALNIEPGNHKFHFTAIDNEDNKVVASLWLISTGE